MYRLCAVPFRAYGSFSGRKSFLNSAFSASPSLIAMQIKAMSRRTQYLGFRSFSVELHYKPISSACSDLPDQEVPTSVSSCRRHLEGCAMRCSPFLPSIRLRLGWNDIYNMNQRRFIWGSSQRQADPYAILGVPRTATPAEVKKAYFREAKKCHPDLNPGDPDAKARFQRLTAAYEAIQNPGKSTDYYETTYGSQGHQAEDVFESVWDDIAVVKEAIAIYGKDLQEEIEMIIDAAKQREWGKVWEAANQHKGIILGVFVPLLVVFRFPLAALLAGRLLFSLIGSIAVPLFYSGHGEVMTKWLWRRIVAEARAKAAVRRAPK